MTLLPTDHVYYSSRKWWSQNYLQDNPPVEQWPKMYREWLLTQGGVIKEYKNRDDMVTDSLQVAPGWDQFEFKDEADAIMFVLRWS